MGALPPLIRPPRRGPDQFPQDIWTQKNQVYSALSFSCSHFCICSISSAPKRLKSSRCRNGCKSTTRLNKPDSFVSKYPGGTDLAPVEGAGSAGAKPPSP